MPTRFAADTDTGAPQLAPARRALLDTLSYAEGTWNDEAQAPNYRMRFGDKRNSEGTLDITKPHPLNVIPSPWGGSGGSNASGAYQFLDHTWSEMNDNNNAVMSPENQDRAASRLIDHIGYDAKGDFVDQLPILANRWASFPNEHGVSNYKQPVKSAETLNDFYQARLEGYNTPPPEESTPMIPDPGVSIPNSLSPLIPDSMRDVNPVSPSSWDPANPTVIPRN